MIKRPGAKATRSQQLLLAPLVHSYPFEKVIIHHVTEDSPQRLQVEIERHRYYADGSLNKITFERIIL